MKGVIFNIFEQFIDENFGEDVWEDALEETKHDDKVFVGTDTYEDSILLDIFGSIVNAKNLVPGTALELFGQYTFKILAKSYPDLVAQFDNPKDFLKGLDSIIHVEVRKLMPESDPPQFLILNEKDDTLVMEYRSKRNMCQLATGLMKGLKDHFDNKFEISHSECIHEGGGKCVFDLTFQE